jgi:hypothetical protein
MESVFGIQDSGITEQICMLQIQVGPDLNISSLLRSNSVLCFVCLFVCLFMQIQAAAKIGTCGR